MDQRLPVFHRIVSLTAVGDVKIGSEKRKILGSGREIFEIGPVHRTVS